MENNRKQEVKGLNVRERVLAKLRVGGREGAKQLSGEESAAAGEGMCMNEWRE